MTFAPYDLATENLASYCGDVNLACGGRFVHIDESRHYATVIEYIDGSDVGCMPYESEEYDEKTIVEQSTVPLHVAKLSQWRSALSCVGIKPSALVGMSRTHKAVELTLALHSYGFRDIDQTDELDGMTDSQLLDDASERLKAL